MLEKLPDLDIMLLPAIYSLFNPLVCFLPAMVGVTPEDIYDACLADWKAISFVRFELGNGFFC